jgi:hypothetical protein
MTRQCLSVVVTASSWLRFNPDIVEGLSIDIAALPCSHADGNGRGFVLSDGCTRQ